MKAGLHVGRCTLTSGQTFPPPMPTPPSSPDSAVEAFITRWEPSGAAERSNAQTFLTELCDLLELEHPDPAVPEETENGYVFEKSIPRVHSDGTQTTVSADLYKRGCFMLETKQGATEKSAESAALSSAKQSSAKTAAKRTGHGRRGSTAWIKAMEKARNQARNYIRDLPSEEGRPPFLIVVDVGHCIDLYSEFTCTGGRYVQFPDPRHHRILLADLRDAAIRDRLRKIWTDPQALDPAKVSARVTREIADRLARLAKTFENSGHDPQVVAEFLMRCIFTMFAEDIGLLPQKSFTELLKNMRGSEAGLPTVLQQLWSDMEKGADFSLAVKAKILHFNGGLFERSTALPLDADQLELLIESAEADWQDVEPAIFGTLLERALDPRERHKLGAHYTPRAYVERLVFPTVIDPLREQWDGVKAASIQLRDDEPKEAIAVVKEFHRELCTIRVLDPACGSANFLYVTMEHMKRLEGEVLETLEELEDPDLTFEMAEFKVRPHQFIGLEINPRAVPIAELVLQIGYLQWHFRTSDKAVPDDPVISKQRSITQQDAVLAYDEKIPLKDEDGNIVTHWDGRTTKPHPVTGKEVPDETATTTVFEYVNPRKAEWPEADYLVGNPPFIGNKRMRDNLGDGYVEALRKAWKKDKPDAWDFVMFWWHQAGTLICEGSLRRFGLITTNSIVQPFNRAVLEKFTTNSRNPLHLAFAIPNHPWVDSSDGAAVRIAMTVVETGLCKGRLAEANSEVETSSGENRVDLVTRYGTIQPSLRIGVSKSSAVKLKANERLSNRGMTLVGKGFLLSPKEAPRFDGSDSQRFIKRFLTGRDLAQKTSERYAIDLYGLSEARAASLAPDLYQHLLVNVKPERIQNKRKSYRDRWWVFAEPRNSYRDAIEGASSHILSPRTAKHRYFINFPTSTLGESEVITIALFDRFYNGILSSGVHCTWALFLGGRLGVGNDPRYAIDCFETFPFPAPNAALETHIRELGERLDAHRKQQQAAHPDLTMTGMYNVLEKLRKEEPLTDKDRTIHDNGLVSVLKQIHDELDALIMVAYGWADLIGDNDIPMADRLARGDDALEEAILERLVALNHERAEEEKSGLVRYLRPEFQNPDGDATATQSDLPGTKAKKPAKKKAAKAKKLPWPKTVPQQIAQIRDLLEDTSEALDPLEVAARFARANKEQLFVALETLHAIGFLTEHEGFYSAA